MCRIPDDMEHFIKPWSDSPEQQDTVVIKIEELEQPVFEEVFIEEVKMEPPNDDFSDNYDDVSVFEKVIEVIPLKMLLKETINHARTRKKQ